VSVVDKNASVLEPCDTVTIRVAQSDDERQRVYGFRYQVYIDQLGRAPAGTDHEQRTVTDPLDYVAGAMHFYAMSGARMVATMRHNVLGNCRLPTSIADGLQIERFACWPQE
jgi:hypothetical protein